MIPDVSISGNVPVIYMPLVMILAVSAVKDLYEDLKRKKSDAEENFRPIKQGGAKQVLWKDIRVGQIIRLNQDDYIPADMILIWSSNKGGICYVETKSLDGETNLKHKKIHPDLAKRIKQEEEVLIRTPALSHLLLVPRCYNIGL